MEALVAGHKVERALAVAALPGDAFVATIGWKTLRLFALVTDHITALEATLAAADGAHAVFHEVHQPCALEAKEVIELVRAFLTLNVFEQLERELVAEYEEVCLT
jgi:hypothetical protein